jgi:hypothetical protein
VWIAGRWTSRREPRPFGNALAGGGAQPTIRGYRRLGIELHAPFTADARRFDSIQSRISPSKPIQRFECGRRNIGGPMLADSRPRNVDSLTPKRRAVCRKVTRYPSGRPVAVLSSAVKRVAPSVIAVTRTYAEPAKAIADSATVRRCQVGAQTVMFAPIVANKRKNRQRTRTIWSALRQAICIENQVNVSTVYREANPTKRRSGGEPGKEKQ